MITKPHISWAPSKHYDEFRVFLLKIFKDIEEMNDYYNVFDENYKSKKRNPLKMQEDLSNKLEECIRLEKYEDAIRIRDYMIKMGFKIE